MTTPGAWIDVLLGVLLEPSFSSRGALAAYGQAAAILLLGAVGALLLRERPAARGALLLIALVGAAAAPFLDAALPDLRIAVLPGSSEREPMARTQSTSSPLAPATSEHESVVAIGDDSGDATTWTTTIWDGTTRESPESEEVSMPQTPTDQRRGLGYLLPALLAAGAVLALGRQVVQLAALRRMSRTATPLHDDGWPLDLAEAKRRLEVRREVRLVLQPLLAVPATWGFRRPLIALPATCDQWSSERRLAVLLHELAHVKRADWLALAFARLARGIHWANPLAWWAESRLIQAQEIACDRLVVERGLRPSAYADHLVSIARESRNRPFAVAAVAAARSTDVEVRVMSLLAPVSPSPVRRLLGAGAGVALALLLIATTAALAALQPVPAPPRVVAPRLPVAPLAPMKSLPPPAVEPSLGTIGTLRHAALLPPAPRMPNLVSLSQLSLASAQEPVEDGGEVDDLSSLAAQLGAIEQRLRPFEKGLRETEAKLRPFEEQLRAIELEGRVHEDAMREVERELEGLQRGRERALEAALEPHEQRMKEIEEAMRPIEQRMRAVERELEPISRELEARSRALEGRHREISDEVEQELEALQEQMEPIHERMEAMHRELEPHFAELERVHEEMEPIHEQMEAMHRELEPVHERLEAIHEQLEPIHERMEAVHEQMEPVHEEMERIHESMEPIHEELEAVHRRVERALRGELRDLLTRELGAGVSEAALDAAVEGVADSVNMNVSNGWLRIHGSAPELRDEIAGALRRHGAIADEARIDAAADAILDVQVRIPTGRE